MGTLADLAAETVQLEQAVALTFNKRKMGRTLADIGEGTLADFQGFASGLSTGYVGPGTYTIASDVTLPESVALRIDPAAVFSNKGINFYPTVDFQGSVVRGLNLTAKTVGNEQGYLNYFMNANYLRNEGSSGIGPNAVAIFGCGESKGAGSAAWGGNFIAAANSATASAIGIEVNPEALVSGATATGILISASGFYGTQTGLQISANSNAARMTYGIRILSSAINTSTGSSIYADSQTGAYGIYFDFSAFTGAEIRFPSFAVGATPSGVDSRVIIGGGNSGGGPSIGVQGSGSSPATNKDLTIGALGTGKLKINYASAAAGTPANFTADRYLQIKDTTGTYYIPMRASTW